MSKDRRTACWVRGFPVVRRGAMPALGRDRTFAGEALSVCCVALSCLALAGGRPAAVSHLLPVNDSGVPVCAPKRCGRWPFRATAQVASLSGTSRHGYPAHSRA